MGIKVFFSYVQMVTDQDYPKGCRHCPSLSYLHWIERSRLKPKLASFPCLPPSQCLTGDYSKAFNKRNQAMQQITRRSDNKMINSD